jgi:hypothetical protein
MDILYLFPEKSISDCGHLHLGKANDVGSFKKGYFVRELKDSKIYKNHL